VRPLIGSDERGELICGPCAGASGLDYTCRECGRSGEIHSDRRCYRCVLAGRARALLSDRAGDVSPQLQPLLAAFSTVTNPATVVNWSWLDQRNQPLDALTQADLDQWLIEGTTTRRAVRYFIQWARARHLTGDVSVPLPPRSEPVRLLGEDDHIHQLDRCLSDDGMSLDLRVGGALVLLFGLLASRGSFR
jgi:hypothetical protein